MCPFSNLAFLQPTTVDKEPQKTTSSYELVDFSSMYQHFLGDFLAR